MLDAYVWATGMLATVALIVLFGLWLTGSEEDENREAVGCLLKWAVGLICATTIVVYCFTEM